MLVLLEGSCGGGVALLFAHSDLRKWKKIEIWAVIKYIVKKTMKAKDIHADF